MLIDPNRYPQSESEDRLCREPFHNLLIFFNEMTGVRKQYPSDEVLQRWVNSIILSALDAHLTNNNDSANWYVGFGRAAEDKRYGPLQSVAMGLGNNGTLDHRRVGQTQDIELRLSDEFLEQHPNLKAEILNHSRPFDVHKWSDHQINRSYDNL
jgi:hypothetical protein